MLLFTCCRRECSGASPPLRALLTDQWASTFKHGVSQQIDRPRVLDWYGEIMSHVVLPSSRRQKEAGDVECEQGWRISKKSSCSGAGEHGEYQGIYKVQNQSYLRKDKGCREK